MVLCFDPHPARNSSFNSYFPLTPSLPEPNSLSNQQTKCFFRFVPLFEKYFWYVLFLLFRVNVTILDKNDTTPNSSENKPRKIVKRISKLKPFTLYAFQVEAVVLKNEGAKSDLVFIQTKESGKLGESQRYYTLQNKNSPETYQYVSTFNSANLSWKHISYIFQGQVS